MYIGILRSLVYVYFLYYDGIFVNRFVVWVVGVFKNEFKWMVWIFGDIIMKV